MCPPEKSSQLHGGVETASGGRFSARIPHRRNRFCSAIEGRAGSHVDATSIDRKCDAMQPGGTPCDTLRHIYELTKRTHRVGYFWFRASGSRLLAPVIYRSRGVTH